MNYKVKIINSLEKCFLDTDFDKLERLERISCLKNEKLNFQIAYTVQDDQLKDKVPCYFKIESQINDFINLYTVEHVACRFPVYFNKDTQNYQRTKPGLYPDILMPYDIKENVYFVPEITQTIYVECDFSNNEKVSGEFTIKCIFYDKDDNVLIDEKLNLKVIDCQLEKQRLLFTQWFHGDCLASYYDVKPLSDKHFDIMRDYIKTAREYGINTILTPVLTPALDTKIGGERPDMQLVTIYKNEDGYSFSYELLDKWINMCLAEGIEYFEISHFFTQWGAKHAPKVKAYVNGKKKKKMIFGWHTDATSKEYTYFIRDFITCLLSHLKKIRIDDKCIFHISDEPNESNIQNYKAAKDSIMDLLDGYSVTDALSSPGFYKEGIVEDPIPANDHIHSFIDAGAKNLWTYYCGGQHSQVSNRFLSMPLYRNRIIGVQFYKYDIKGFLHWGYNFYYNQFSRKLINPFLITDGEFFTPAGDAYSVYPGFDKKPLKSIRLTGFYEAISDLRALKTLESLTSYDYVMSLVEKDVSEITFFDYPQNSDYLLRLREIVNRKIEEFI